MNSFAGKPIEGTDEEGAIKIVESGKSAKQQEQIVSNPTAPPEQIQQAQQKLNDLNNETNQIVAKHPDSPPVLTEGAKYALNRGDPSTALTRANHLIEVAPDKGDGYALTAAAKDKLGSKEEALGYAIEALKRDPNNRLALGIKNLYQGRVTPHVNVPSTPAKPQGDSTPLQDLQPQSPKIRPTTTAKQLESESLINQSINQLKLDPQQALRLADSAVTADPENPRAYAQRAQTYLAMKDVDSVIKDITRAIDLGLKDAVAYNLRALAHLMKKQFEAAKEDALLAIDAYPKSAYGYKHLALAQAALHEPKETVAATARQAVALDPTLAASLEDAMRGYSGEAPQPVQRMAPQKEKKPALPWIFILGAIGAGVTLAGFALILKAGRGGSRSDIGRINTRVSTDPARPKLSSATLPPGMILGDNYKIIKEVGRGGMGVVYEAEDTALQRRVAIKQLYRNRIIMQDDLDRFLREARTVAKLKHTNIAEIYSVVEEDDLYLVFDFVHGKTLGALIGEKGKLACAEAAALLKQISAAVQFAHTQNIIHRDLKPGNVMVTPEGLAKVMDFGLAHQSQSGAQTQVTVAGTPPYMAPEQASGSVSKASDVYAMGIMAYEMLTGELPFSGPDFLGQKLRFGQAGVTPGLPSQGAALDAFFVRALSPDAAKRYAGAAEFIKAFEAVVESYNPGPAGPAAKT